MVQKVVGGAACPHSSLLWRPFLPLWIFKRTVFKHLKKEVCPGSCVCKIHPYIFIRTEHIGVVVSTPVSYSVGHVQISSQNIGYSVFFRDFTRRILQPRPPTLLNPFQLVIHSHSKIGVTEGNVGKCPRIDSFFWGWPKWRILKQRRKLVRFQDLTTASMKMTVFWDVAPCSLTEVYRRFRCACCLHHQVDDPAFQRNILPPSLGLKMEDWDSIFLWNVDT
jgi:hypothetical protein